MFMYIIIYFTHVFEDNHIFLFKCLHRNLLTSKTVIKNDEINTKQGVFLYLTKMKNHSDIYSCLILVYIF